MDAGRAACGPLAERVRLLGFAEGVKEFTRVAPKLGLINVDPHLDVQATAIFPRQQAAPVVRKGFRQHWHDTIGEIDTVAAE